MRNKWRKHEGAKSHWAEQVHGYDEYTLAVQGSYTLTINAERIPP